MSVFSPDHVTIPASFSMFTLLYGFCITLSHVVLYLFVWQYLFNSVNYLSGVCNPISFCSTLSYVVLHLFVWQYLYNSVCSPFFKASAVLFQYVVLHLFVWQYLHHSVCSPFFKASAVPCHMLCFTHLCGSTGIIQYVHLFSITSAVFCHLLYFTCSCGIAYIIQ